MEFASYRRLDDLKLIIARRLMFMPNSFATLGSLASSRDLAGPAAGLGWRERRAWFQARLFEQPIAGIGKDEVEVHFAGMPPHYWEQVTESDLTWSLQTIHGFLRHVASPQVSATAPFVTWRQLPQLGRTRIMLCTWDRHGLLAKAAAAFSAVKFNIVQASVFTRADNIVLDEFTVTDADARTLVNETRLREMTFLLEGALSEPPRFASVWACSRHKFLAPPTRVTPRITFDNHTSPEATIVGVEAPDRLGLLYDILQALADDGLNVKVACIATDELARDFIHVADELGHKILDPNRLEKLRACLVAALTVKDGEC